MGLGSTVVGIQKTIGFHPPHRIQEEGYGWRDLSYPLRQEEKAGIRTISLCDDLEESLLLSCPFLDEAKSLRHSARMTEREDSMEISIPVGGASDLDPDPSGIYGGPDIWMDFASQGLADTDLGSGTDTAYSAVV